MALSILPSHTDGFRLHPVAPRLAPMFCFVLLTVSCALASLAFACATPFAAFAVAAAAMLSLRPALLVVTGAWLVNQAIGFGVLHYPIDGSTIAWGFVIGAAALLSTVAASVVLRKLPQGRTPMMLAVPLVVAYAAYEIALLAATPFLGGEGAFTAAVVTRIGLTSAAWLAGLVAACEIVRLVDPFGLRHLAVSPPVNPIA
ncbi:hypothetical protein CVM73_04040 [Bradyrhizobium forestalis]|uniref:Uncharacterized protein n=1 Tax=Bradyrhizobium forestalis TaxID=1419263 RepID=A0A2M8RFY8_9BRAD|nr:hypothetical protein [Bradyrhizobium forestalis]PJG56722.1 hypothetical protein CVM73_04040 [Bradyrhizobium forestalis]